MATTRTKGAKDQAATKASASKAAAKANKTESSDKAASPKPETKTRPYCAGLVCKEHGVTAGVTKEMVAALDALYGKPNPRESRFTLRYAVDAIRAFNGIQVPAKE